MGLPCLLFLEYNNYFQERRIQFFEALLKGTIVLAVVDMIGRYLLLLLPRLLIEEFLGELNYIGTLLLLLYERDSFSIGL